MTREQYDEYIRTLQHQRNEDVLYTQRASTLGALHIHAKLEVVK